MLRRSPPLIFSALRGKPKIHTILHIILREHCPIKKNAQCGSKSTRLIQMSLNILGSIAPMQVSELISQYRQGIRNFPCLSLPGVSLQGINLQDASVRESNFQQSDLSHGNLAGANLREANLQGAKLCFANLT